MSLTRSGNFSWSLHTSRCIFSVDSVHCTTTNFDFQNSTNRLLDVFTDQILPIFSLRRDLHWSGGPGLGSTDAVNPAMLFGNSSVGVVPGDATNKVLCSTWRRNKQSSGRHLDIFINIGKKNRQSSRGSARAPRASLPDT